MLWNKTKQPGGYLNELVNIFVEDRPGTDDNDDGVYNDDKDNSIVELKEIEHQEEENNDNSLDMILAQEEDNNNDELDKIVQQREDNDESFQIQLDNKNDEPTDVIRKIDCAANATAY